MKKSELEKLGEWPEVLQFETPNLRLTVRCNSPQARDSVKQRLKATWGEQSAQHPGELEIHFLMGKSSGRSIRSYHHLYCQEQRVLRSTILERVLATLEVQVHEHGARHASQLYFHGRVWWSGDETWAVLGPHSVEAMKAQSWQLFSNPYFVLNEDSKAHSYPKLGKTRALTGVLIPQMGQHQRLEAPASVLVKYLLRAEFAERVPEALRDIPVWMGPSIPDPDQ